MLPLAEIVVPVKLTAVTVPPPLTLAPVILPVEDNIPPLNIFPPVTLPLKLAVVPV